MKQNKITDTFHFLVVYFLISLMDGLINCRKQKKPTRLGVCQFNKKIKILPEAKGVVEFEQEASLNNSIAVKVSMEFLVGQNLVLVSFIRLSQLRNYSMLQVIVGHTALDLKKTGDLIILSGGLRNLGLKSLI